MCVVYLSYDMTEASPLHVVVKYFERETQAQSPQNLLLWYQSLISSNGVVNGLLVRRRHSPDHVRRLFEKRSEKREMPLTSPAYLYAGGSNRHLIVCVTALCVLICVGSLIPKLFSFPPLSPFKNEGNYCPLGPSQWPILTLRHTKYSPEVQLTNWL